MTAGDDAVGDDGDSTTGEEHAGTDGDSDTERAAGPPAGETPDDETADGEDEATPDSDDPDRTEDDEGGTEGGEAEEAADDVATDSEEEDDETEDAATDSEEEDDEETTEDGEETTEDDDPEEATEGAPTDSAEEDGDADTAPTADGGGGEMAVPGGAAAPEPDAPEPTPSTFEGAPDDEEMPLTEHIREMVQRLGVVIVVMAAISLVTFPFADQLINLLWYSFLPGSPQACATGAPATAFEAIARAHAVRGEGTAACPRVYHPLGLVLARLKVASLSGFIFALPVFVYQTYLFMRPGLYPHERRYYLASVPTSLVLAFIGIAFAFFLVLPFIFTYFLTYSEPVANIAFGLGDTFGLILLMLGMFAAIFQIPLFMMLAIMMGVTTRQWIESRRLYFWAAFAGIAFLFSPDPTGMAPFIVGITMVGLFETTLVLLRWTGR